MRVFLSKIVNGVPKALRTKNGLYEGNFKMLKLYQRKNKRWEKTPLIGDEPKAFLIVMFDGEFDSKHIEREITTTEDWEWLASTYGVTKFDLRLGVV